MDKAKLLATFFSKNLAISWLFQLLAINTSLKNRKDFIVTTGVGNHQMMSCQFINWRYPQRFISSGSLGVMGAGLPYAIGVQFANQKKSVINIDGDSSFLMTLSDLKTVKEHNLPLKILIPAFAEPSITNSSAST